MNSKLERICNSSKINGAETEVTISKDDFIWLVESIKYIENRKEEILVESGKGWTQLIKIKQILDES